MARILITGGNGRLGRVLVSKLSGDPSYIIRVISRCPQPDDLKPGLEWAQADLETGKGLNQAVDAVQTIIHAATNPLRHSRRVDVNGILYTWLKVRGLPRKFIHIYLPGKTVEGFRKGYHTTPQNRQGRLTWREWLERKYAKCA